MHQNTPKRVINKTLWCLFSWNSFLRTFHMYFEPPLSTFLLRIERLTFTSNWKLNLKRKITFFLWIIRKFFFHLFHLTVKKISFKLNIKKLNTETLEKILKYYLLEFRTIFFLLTLYHVFWVCDNMNLFWKIVQPRNPKDDY